MDDLATEMEVAYAKEYSKAIYNLIGSITTFLVLMFIFRGSFWVYFLLLWVANCVRDVIQANLLKRQITNPVAFQAALSAYKEDHGKKKRKKKHEELPRITSLRPRVPANLLFAIEGALVKDRERRWQSADDFLQHLTYDPPPVLAAHETVTASRAEDEPTVRFRRVASEPAPALREPSRATPPPVSREPRRAAPR